MEGNNIPQWMTRTNLLLGEDRIAKLMNAHVLVVGLGGVGGIAAEMIARAGVGKMTIIDADTVEASNRNRQIPALVSTNGVLKTEAMASRIRDINPDIELNVKSVYLTVENREEILNTETIDMALDCIDTLSPKVFFIKHCVDNKIPLVSSMGAGGRVDPSMIEVADISKSHDCLLAYDVRKRLHALGIYKGFKVVFSPEPVDKSRIVATPDEDRKKSVIGTISYMPAAFGIFCASVAIRDLMER